MFLVVSSLLICLHLDCCTSSCSIVKDIEEALVELLLPELALGRDSDDHQALIRSRVNVYELAFLRLEVCLACAFGVLSCLVQLIRYGHVHLDFDASEVDMVIFVTHNQILIAIVPEKWVSLHLNQLVRGRGRIALSIVLEALQVVELHGDNAARLRIFDLESAIQDADLQPMIPIELRDQVTGLIAQGELLGVA